MCTKILKKESSSRALAFVLLMFMMPLGFIGNTHSCGAMEESEPLLINESKSGSTRSSSRVGLDDPGEEISSGKLYCDHIEEVQVKHKILEQADREEAAKNRAAAEKKMKEIIDFISLHHGVSTKSSKTFKRLQDKYKSEVSAETVEELLKHLEDLAWKAIIDQPTLASYMKDLREQKESLIVDVEGLMEERASLRRLTELCDQYLKSLEKKKLESRKRVEIIPEGEADNQTTKVLQRENNMLRYIVTPVSFVLGVVLGGVGTGLFMHYYFMGR